MRSVSPPSGGAEAPSGAPVVPEASPKRPAPRSPFKVLRYGLLLLLAVIGAAVLYASFVAPRPGGPPLSTPEAREGVAQRALNLDTIRTRRGLPSVRVTAREGLTYRDRGSELHDVLVTLFRAGGDKVEISAPRAVSGEEGVSGWSFKDGVEIRGEKDLRARVPELLYRESPQEVSAEGEVSFERGDLRGRARGLRYLVARKRLQLLSQVEITLGAAGPLERRIRADSAILDQDGSRIRFRDYSAEAASGETIEGASLLVNFEEGERSRPRRVEAREGFRASVPEGGKGTGLLGSGARTLSGETLAVDLLEDGRMDRAEASGAVRAVLAAPGAEPRTLECGRLTVGFAEGRAVSLVAEENASLVIPRAGVPAASPALLRAAAIRADLDPADGSVRILTAEGDAAGEDRGRRFAAGSIRWDVAADLWQIEGGAESPARAVAEGATLSALHIELRRADETLMARGDVKTVTVPGAGDPRAASPGGEFARPAPTLFGSEKGPVHGICGALTLTRAGRIARYREKVRIWQGNGSLEAAAVDLNDEAGVLEAHGGVVARVAARSRDRSRLQIVTVSSSDLRYERSSGEALFTGKVRAQSGSMRIDADSITARGAAGEAITHLQADGEVRLQEGKRLGEGDTLTASFADDRFVLAGRGRLAVIQDQSTQQLVKGAVLTYEGSADRILVESESGGRTWITLTSKPAEGKESDPEPPR